MPNWCANGITLKHNDPAMIDRAQHSEGLLMEFLPTPQELLETEAGYFSDTARQAELENHQAANVQKYGATDWYDWNIRNWGTKWDVKLENVERVDEYTLTAAFDSAWSPPVEAYERLLEMGFDIVAYYYEPGMCFVGKWDNGDDLCIEYTAGSKGIREEIGEELDDYFGISEEMSQYEDEE